MAQFSQDEAAAIDKVAVGTRGQNWARLAGKLAPTSVISAAPAAWAASHFGALSPAAAALAGGTVAGVGIIGKKIADAVANKNVRYAEELIRGGKEGPKQAQKYRRAQRLNKAIAAALMAEATQGGRPTE